MRAMILSWVAAIAAAGQVSGADSLTAAAPSASLLALVNDSWFTSPGVREVADPETQSRFLIATGIATMSVKMPRPTAERILAARARLDAIRRAVEHQQGGEVGNLVIEGSPQGIIHLCHRQAPGDSAGVLVTLAIEPGALTAFVVKPAQPVTTRPAPQPSTAPAASKKPDAVSPLAQVAGAVAGTVKDAILTTPDVLIRQAQEALESEEYERAAELATRAGRIGASQTAIDQVRRERNLREALKRAPASDRGFLALAEWAERHGRLGAVAGALDSSAAAIVRAAGAEAFVGDPSVFYWLGVANEAAGRIESAAKAYAAAVRFGVGHEFHDDADERLRRIREQIAQQKEAE